MSVLSWGALLLLIWKGRAPERLAAFAFFTVMIGTPLVEDWRHGSLRTGVALLSLGLAITLIVLSLRAARWWLMAAAGLQLIVLATYVVTLINPDVQVWSIVSVRMLVWVQLMACALFGVFEAQFAPYSQPSKPVCAP